MAISDLQPKQGSVELTAVVKEKSDVREFEKFGKQGKVCNAKIADESGEMTLTLWNDQIDQVDVGDKIQVTNGYVSEWKGDKQLSTGKFGKLEVVEKGADVPASSSEPDVPEKDDVEEEAIE